MASKLYEIAFQLGAKLQSSYGSTFSAAQKQLNGLNKESQRANKGFMGLSGGIGKAAKALTGVAAAYIGITSVKDYIDQGVEAAKNRIQQETKLQTILQNVRTIQKQGPGAYKAATKELVGTAKQLQKVGIITRNVSVAGYQQLATFQLGSKEIGILSGGMADLLAQQKGFNATGEDAVGIANMMGKVMDGNVGALRRVGVSFTKAQEAALKTGDSIQRATILAQVLKDNVGGVNSALRQTDQGKIQAAKNTFAAIRTEVGSRIIPLQAKFATMFSTTAPFIEKVVLGIVDGITNGINLIGKGINKVSNYLSPFIKTFKSGVSTFFKGDSINSVIKFVSDRVKDIIKVFQSLQPGFKKFVSGYKSNFKSIITVTKQVFSFYVKNILPLVANTYTFITKDILPALAKAFKKWLPMLGNIASNVGKLIIAVWNFVKPILLGVLAVIKFIFPIAKQIVMGAISSIVGIISGLLKILNGVILFVTGIFTGDWKKAWEGVREIFKGIFSTLGAILKAPINAVIALINTAISGINKINIKVPSWVPLLGGKSFGINIPKIPMLASGGYIKHRTGGILANIGEGREDEIVSPISKLRNVMNSTSNSNRMNFTYAPHVIIQGNASKDDITQALSISKAQFKKLIDDYKSGKERLSLNPS